MANLVGQFINTLQRLTEKPDRRPIKPGTGRSLKDILKSTPALLPLQTQNAPGLPYNPHLPNAPGYRPPGSGAVLGFGAGVVGAGLATGFFDNFPGLDTGGPMPWDSSTQLADYSIPPPQPMYQTSPTQASPETSWEDSVVSVASTLAPLLI